MVRRCEAVGVSVSHVPRLFEAAVERLTVDHLGGLPLVTMQRSNPRGWQFFVKYLIDRFVAGALLLLMLPLLIAIAVAVKLSTGGPVLFRQSRCGLDGKQFSMLKFRTMRGSPDLHGESDADWATEVLNGKEPNGRVNGRVSDAEEDRRTKLGHILRKLSLDELPQLWNIFRGDMSLIGPRPERVSYVKRFERAVHRYGDRHRVKSGMTGWAQVHGLRGQTSLADRVEWDNYYIENWSLWLDFKIFLLTFAALFSRAE
jgi:exopolysaccharide biosynthesis polyprenyl glycosylphosphotransferase